MRLRSLIVLALVLVACVPVAVLSVHTHRSAYAAEESAVVEKHLLISEHLARTLDRYAEEAVLAFEEISETLKAGSGLVEHDMAIARLHFERIGLYDATGVARAVACARDCDAGTEQLDAAFLERATALLYAANAGDGRTVFSGVIADASGTPSLFLAQAIEGGGYALGKYSTTYIADLQRSVGFGTNGHAVIVDRNGIVIAHPNPALVAQMRDMSSLGPVERLKRGETGVGRFISPSFNVEMIAGFSAAERAGWGVIVPQPVKELEESVAYVQRGAIIASVAAIIATIAVSLLLAWVIDRSLRPVLAAALRNTEGEIGAETSGLPIYAPREMRELAESFNRMARRIGDAFNNERRALAAARRANETNQAKSRFVAQVSHEFRTPLNAILGFSEVIRDEHFGESVPARYKEYAALIHKSGAHLLGLIDHTIDISRTELGRSKLREEWVDIGEMAHEMSEIVTEAHRKTAHRRVVDIAPGLPKVWADRQVLRQILINLLSNAEKFTPNGGTIALSASCLPNGAVELAVSDTGCGIAKEDIPRALAPFGRVEGAGGEQTEGTGLGLTLANSLIEVHGGRLKLESVPGEGTTVRITLPPSRSDIAANDEYERRVGHLRAG